MNFLILIVGQADSGVQGGDVMAKDVELKICPYCNRAFKSKVYNQIYCSMDCRKKYYLEHPEIERIPVNYKIKEVKCQRCGKIVPRKSGQQKYCIECSKIIIKEKSKEYKSIYADKQKQARKTRKKKKLKDRPEERAKALGLTYGKYVAIMDGYLPGKDDLLKREAEIFGKRSKVDKNHHRHI